MIKIFLVVLLLSFPASAANRAVATAPGESLIYIELTAQEQTTLDAREASWQAAKPTRDWEDQMDAIKLSDDFENIMDGMNPVDRANIPAETLNKYNDKKALRLLKP